MIYSKLAKLYLNTTRKPIHWEKSTREILKDINGNFLSKVKSERYSFLYGFKISISKCKIIKDNDESIVPGGITRVLDNGCFIVRCKDGFIEVDEFVIHSPYKKFKDMKEFLKKINIAEEPTLMTVPFASNQEANRWEAVHNRLVIDNLETLEKNSQREEFEIDETTSFTEKKVKEMAKGTETVLIDKNLDFISFLVNKIDLNKGSRTLDIGCGSGWMSHILSRLGMDSYGCDISPYCIEIARGAVPSAKFYTLDIFELPKKPQLRGKFDFVICRDLGIAQKIVNWGDEKWISVGKSIVDLLSEEGVLYWIQMSDLTETITEDGFSNPSMKTMIEYFRGFSHIIDVNLLGFQSFLISKNPPSSELIKQVNTFTKNNDSKIYSAWIRSKTEKNINQLSKVLVSKVSQIFLYENDFTKSKILIIGDNEIARSYANICQKLNLKYKKLSENEIKSNCESDFSTVIFTDSNQQKRIDKMKNNSKCIIYPFEYRDENNYVDTYLISGDQDLECGKVIISDIEKILH